MKEPYRKGNSESILASSLAGDTARYRLKRRQRYRWAGLLSFEKPMEQDADSIPSGGRQHDNHTKREWIARSCVVLEPAHAEKQHAREPGDLLHVLVSRSRPVREGHKPHGGHERTGEVGLCRNTSEPAEQRRAACLRRRPGREGHRLRRTLFNHTCVRHRAGSACPRDCTVCGQQHVPPPFIHSKSRMRKRARTDLRGGRSAMVVPTATVRRRAEFYYQQLDALRTVRQEVRRELLAEGKKHKAWKRLCQIPSIGPIRSAVLLGILQTPHRFRTKRQLWTYSGFGIENDRLRFAGAGYAANRKISGTEPQAKSTQQRLHQRYRKLLAKGKNKLVVVTAIGRELLGFI